MGNRTSNFSTQVPYGNDRMGMQKPKDLTINNEYESPKRNAARTQSMPSSPAFRESDFESPTKLYSPRLLGRVFSQLSPQAMTKAFHFPDEDPQDAASYHHRQVSKHQLFQAEVFHETFN